MSPRRIPVSRRDRPAKPALSRDGAVAVAARVMREEGLEKVTMRRLATELDTGPASLYVYVRNMAEVHGALFDELLADLRPVAPGGEWRAALIEVMTGYTEVLLAHPAMARSVLVLRPSGPNYLRLIDTILGLLDAGGVPAGQAARGVDLLLQHGAAFAAEQDSRGRADDVDEVYETLVMAVSEADESGYPNVARARTELLAGDASERLAWGFAALIAGITAVPAD